MVIDELKKSNDPSIVEVALVCETVLESRNLDNMMSLVDLLDKTENEFTRLFKGTILIFLIEQAFFEGEMWGLRRKVCGR